MWCCGIFVSFANSDGNIFRNLVSLLLLCIIYLFYCFEFSLRERTVVKVSNFRHIYTICQAYKYVHRRGKVISIMLLYHFGSLLQWGYVFYASANILQPAACFRAVRVSTHSFGGAENARNDIERKVSVLSCLALSAVAILTVLQCHFSRFQSPRLFVRASRTSLTQCFEKYWTYFYQTFSTGAFWDERMLQFWRSEVKDSMSNGPVGGDIQR